MNRWLEEHLWAGDAVLATGLLVIAALVHGPDYDHYSLLMSVLLMLPLYARRSRPKSMLVIVALLCLLQVTVIGLPVFGDVAAPLVVHSATAHVRDRRWGVAGLVAGLVGAGLGALRWSREWTGSYQYLVLAGAGVATVVAAYLLGARQRDRRERVEEQVAALQERNRLLATERDQRTAVVAAGERALIARELHDIVAHSLSVIVVQADGGAAAVTAAPGAAAELAPQVLRTIAETSRDALAEMRRMVTVLRSGSTDPATTGIANTEPDYAPAPGTPQIPDLVAQVTALGVPVSFTERGARRELSPTTGLTVYRVVQESLTNVIKHAGPAASATVTLDYLDDGIAVAVVDDGRGCAWDGQQPGHGLVGMRERVGMQGGTVRAEPLPGGGFAVQASIPLPRVPTAIGVSR